MKKSSFFYILLLVAASIIYSCKKPESTLKGIYDNALASDASHQVLEYLSKQAPGRLAGTEHAQKAIEYVRQRLMEYRADSVWLFPVEAPGWSELKTPEVWIDLGNNRKQPLRAVGLGQSVSTTEQGIRGQIVVISNKDQIDSLGERGLRGKIVFFNQKMEVRGDYGKYVWQRVSGASMVAKYGATGVLVRSLTTARDDNPHTGVVVYNEAFQKIPAVALSWQAADTLEKYSAFKPGLEIGMKTFCNNPGLVRSFNVLGEIKGSQYPEKVLLLTAHLDSWHNTPGAHDNAGGVAQILDVVRIFKDMGIKPKHTIRVMAYMDEEQFLNGIKQYAGNKKDPKDTHVFNIEVDYGIGIPVGFNIQADSVVFTQQEKWRKLLQTFSLDKIRFTNNYATHWPLYDSDETILCHLVCKDDRYFDYHHAANDVFESVDKRNLQSGGAALAAFLYLIDEMELIDNSKRVNK
jgi:hypothetical protein